MKHACFSNTKRQKNGWRILLNTFKMNSDNQANAIELNANYEVKRTYVFD